MDKDKMNVLEKNKQLLESAPNYCGKNIKFGRDYSLGKYFSYEEDINTNQILIVCNDIYVKNIIAYELKNRVSYNYTKLNTPFYVYYDEQLFYYVMELCDLEELLNNERVVLIVGKENLDEYFQDFNVLFPNAFVGYQTNEVRERINIIYKARCSVLDEIKKESELYYLENEEAIKERIRAKDFTLLIIVYDDFTYERIQKFYREFSKKINTIIAYEDSASKRICNEFLINAYKPDAVFALNRYRADFMGDFPERLPLITYIEDPRIPQFLTGFHKTLGKNDLLLNIFTKFERLKRTLIGNETWREIPSVSVNAYSEKIERGEVTPEEHQIYDSDLSFICSQVDFLPIASSLLDLCSSNLNLQKELEDFIIQLYELQYLEKSTIIGKAQLEDAVNKMLDKYNLAEVERVCIYWYLYNIKYLIDRYVMIQWIIEEKKYRFHIWGFGGTEVEAFKPYARGSWKNEREKYLVISCSKVIVQNEAQSGLVSPKFSEVLENDSMMLAEYTDPAIEISDYNKYCREGVGICFYRSRKELFEKLDYYLSHEEERQNVIKKGKDLLRRELNYNAVTDYWIDAISRKV